MVNGKTSLFGPEMWFTYAFCMHGTYKEVYRLLVFSKLTQKSGSVYVNTGEFEFDSSSISRLCQVLTFFESMNENVDDVIFADIQTISCASIFFSIIFAEFELVLKVIISYHAFIEFHVHLDLNSDKSNFSLFSLFRRAL